MNKSLLLSFFLMLSVWSKAQEFNITVQVNAPRLNKVDPKVFETLKSQIENFVNNTRWTDDEYEDFERIEGNLNITITEEISATRFSADLFVQTIRPVFNSNYKSQVINYVDKVAFDYQEHQPLENSSNSYTNSLSSLLSFHIYMMLGNDYDTYESLGGSPYFLTAQNIISALPATQSANSGEWSSKGNSRNKYWMSENMNNSRVVPLRQAIYDYYVKGLDTMHENAGLARAVMTSALGTIENVHRSFPNSFVVQTFADSKRDEIIDIYKGGGRGEQSKIYDIMVKLDPAQASRYNDIK